MVEIKEYLGFLVTGLFTIVSVLLGRMVNRLYGDIKENKENINKLEAKNLITREEVSELQKEHRLEIQRQFTILRNDHNVSRTEVVDQIKGCREDHKDLRKDMVRALDRIHDLVNSLVDRSKNQRKDDSKDGG